MDPAAIPALAEAAAGWAMFFLFLLVVGGWTASYCFRRSDEKPGPKFETKPSVLGSFRVEYCVSFLVSQD